MSNEERSNSLMDKLDGLSSLPGEASFNKAAAWDRLQLRMAPQPSKKRVGWYWWAAAACILLVALLPFLPKEKETAVTPSLPLTQQSATATPSVVAIPVRKDIPVKQKTIATSVRKPLRQLADTPVVSTAGVACTIELPLPGAPLVATVPPVATPAPRQMRVVHINDVGGDVIGNTYIYPEHKQFKVAISGPAGFASQVVADRSSNTGNPPKN